MKHSVANTANETAPVRQMKTFNKLIKIEVSVDDIAQKLLATFPADYIHKEMLTETIIGTSLNSSKISYIYNALNGYSADIDFQVGDRVFCGSEERRVNKFVDEQVPEGELNPNWKPKRVFKTYDNVAIEECEVVEIDLYSDNKLKVRYLQDEYRSEERTDEQETWVNHRTCTKLAKLEPVDKYGPDYSTGD